MFSPVLFRLGILYERLTSLELLRSLRGSILCVFEKRGRAEMGGPVENAAQKANALNTIGVS
jgi:hypothetical protein